MRHHFTPTRMAVIGKRDNNKYYRRCGGIGTLRHCRGNMKYCGHFENGLAGPPKLKNIELPHDPATPKRIENMFPELIHGCS